MVEALSISVDDLLEASGLGSGTRGLSSLAKDLSKFAKRVRPWSWQYLHQVRSGKLKASRQLKNAMANYALVLDGRSPLIASSHEVEVFGEKDLAGAYIMGRDQRCPSCGLKFVPNVPWRSKCPTCSPPR